MSSEQYASPRAVESAILSAARVASAEDPSISVSDRIQQEYFRRFLSRVFSHPGDTGWILKGGTGVLARIASARTTRDVDLFRQAQARAINLPERFAVPQQWGRLYVKDARLVPACEGFRTVEDAMGLTEAEESNAVGIVG